MGTVVNWTAHASSQGVAPTQLQLIVAMGSLESALSIFCHKKKQISRLSNFK